MNLLIVGGVAGGVAGGASAAACARRLSQEDRARPTNFFSRPIERTA